ncbi:Uncharacterized protein TCAP_07108 [Tolypocladium capitatum]|uniref:Myb-like domain-containing protein n=1 Tax=Tolypocladium capitatum TaxID=45235 RepID=A0A2K3Q4M4_9HYPO|nr:Uncharacterized protein TCAP_07108 [Tolypocladium capitatum]
MPKHTRNVSASQAHYADALPASLLPSPMYAQQRMAMPADYYAAVGSSSASSALPLPPQQQQQQQQQQPPQQQQQTGYDAYLAEAVTIPPEHHRASSGAWSQQDDQQLVTARMQGLNWGQIKDAFFPSKTANACRKRHERLMERKGSDEWDNRKLQRLAKEYMGMRKEIWSGLAARTGEKWNVVEQKCMSNGLKNLQSAARAASRRDRLETSSHVTGYDDDSGISGIALTPVDELDASYSSPETASSSGPPFPSSSYHHFHHQQQQQEQQQQHHHHHHHHLHLQPQQGSYTTSAYGPASYGHGHSSSVSSTASATADRRYAPHGGGHGEGNNPYVDAERLPSADMGIEAIINRPGGGNRIS